MPNQNVVVLVGGVGGAKLALGLAQILPPQNLTVIVNVGDDFWHYGLKICPDADTILYTLSGLVDKNNGWGVSGDTVNTLEQLRVYGGDSWFRLGDRDIATHLYRTERLRQGARLTQVTAELATALGVNVRLFPVTDDRMETIVHTQEHGALAFQEYFVKHRWQPTLTRLEYAGSESARASAEVIEAIEQADVILIAPSNPYLSVEPMLRIAPLRELLISRAVPRVAVTPIIGAQAVKGPAAKIMRELNLEVSAETVARFYGNVINGFVTDTVNTPFVVDGVRTIALNTLMQTDADKAALANQILHWIMSWD